MIKIKMGKFRIKISPTWWSDEYVKIKYSTNGVFWKKLYGYDYDILDNWCYVHPVIIRYDRAETFLSKFKTIDDIIKFEAEQKEKVIKHNNEITEKNKKELEERKKVYKQFN